MIKQIKERIVFYWEAFFDHNDNLCPTKKREIQEIKLQTIFEVLDQPYRMHEIADIRKSVIDNNDSKKKEKQIEVDKK